MKLLFVTLPLEGKHIITLMDDKNIVTKQTYDNNAHAFDEWFNSFGSRTEDINRAFSYIKKSSPSVFELGCGSGRDAKEILERTNKYLGIDISKELIRLANEKVPRGKFELGDFSTYEFPREIDIIFAFASLVHANKDALRNILIRAYDSLVDGGVFFMSLKYGEYTEQKQEDKFGVRYFYYYTHEVIMDLAGSGYTLAWKNIQDLRGQKWMEIILQKAG